MEGAVQQQLVQATKIIEDQVDNEIDRMERMTEDDFEVLRQKRLDAMKKASAKKQELLSKGHGRYSEIPDEKQFFAECKASDKIVCHFYRESTFRCKIVDKHLEILAKKHIEAKFMKIDAERSKFLSERLKIKTLPTICIARDGKTVDYIVGFDDLGGTDEFSTEMLEWRIARSGVIDYNGDLMVPPGADDGKGGSKLASILGRSSQKNIRGRTSNDSDDDDDW